MVRIMLLIFSKSYANVGGVISRTLVTFSISCEKIMFVTEILIRKIELWIFSFISNIMSILSVTALILRTDHHKIWLPLCKNMT